LAIQNSSANKIDDIVNETEYHTNSQIEQTGDSHKVPGDHIAKGTEGLERTENVDHEGKKNDEDTVDIDQKGGSEMDVNSDAGIDARDEVAIVAKFADESEQRKAGVDAWSEVATYVDYGSMKVLLALVESLLHLTVYLSSYANTKCARVQTTWR